MRVWSSKELKVTVVNDEQELQELENFSMWTLVQYFMREQTNETFVNINLFSPKTCFRVDPSNSQTLYTVKPSRSECALMANGPAWFKINVNNKLNKDNTLYLNQRLRIIPFKAGP